MGDEAKIKLSGDNKGLEKSLKESEGMLKSWSGAVTKVMTVVGAAFVAKQVFDWGMNLMQSAAEADEAAKNLDTTFNAVGATAGVTRKEIDEMADAIENMSVFEAEAAKATSELFLATQKISGDNFRKGLTGAADLAAFMKVDMAQAGKIMAMALAEPERGMMMLRRAGIQFTADQKEAIKTMMESGDRAGAQAVILERLNAVLGGQAASTLDTFSGKMSHLGTKFGDIAEAIGMALIPAALEIMPVLEKIIAVVVAVVTPIAELLGYVASLAAAFWDWLLPLEAIETGIASAQETIVAWVSWLVEELTPAVKFVTAILKGMATVIWDTASALAQAMAPVISSIVDTLIHWAEVIWSYLQPAIIWLADKGLTAFTMLQTAIQNFADVAMIAIETFALAFVKAFNVVVYQLTEVVPAYLAWFGRNWKEIFRDVAVFVGTVFTNMGKNIYNFFSAVMGWFRGEGFDFQWTGLTEGFEATAEELPKIAKRVKGEIEENLEKDIGERAFRVGSAFSKNLKDNRDAIAELWADANKPIKVETEVNADAKKGKDDANAGMTPDDLFGDAPDAKKEKSDSKVGTIEDLLSLSKRITQAAAGVGEGDKTAKAVKDASAEQVAAQHATKDAIDDNTGAVAGTNDRLDKIIGGLSPAGALADG